MRYLVLLAVCLGCSNMPEDPVVMKFQWEAVANHTYRMVDTEHNMVCYTRYESSQNLSCSPLTGKTHGTP